MKLNTTVVFIGILIISSLISCISKREKTTNESSSKENTYVSYTIDRESNFSFSNLGDEENIKSRSVIKSELQTATLLPGDDLNLQPVKWRDSTILYRPNLSVKKKIISNNILTMGAIKIEEVNDSLTRYIIDSKSSSNIIITQDNISQKQVVDAKYIDTVSLPLKHEKGNLTIVKHLFINQSLKSIKIELIKRSKER